MSSIGPESAAPCRHRGAPPEALVTQVMRLIEHTLANDEEYLCVHGLTAEEYSHAFSAAIERLRGSWAASNRERRELVGAIVAHLAAQGLIQEYDIPKYGSDTVYRLTLADGKRIGVVQKGCPDGKHSSVQWTRPKWADELYLWWVCSSQRYQPGEHVWKGVNRVRRKVSGEPKNQLDGIIFFDSLCGTFERPCPKEARSVKISGKLLPPPCIYVFPRWNEKASELNWRGQETRAFPPVLLEAFGIGSAKASHFTGFVGFRRSGVHSVRTEITSHYGPAKASTARG